MMADYSQVDIDELIECAFLQIAHYIPVTPEQRSHEGYWDTMALSTRRGIEGFR